MQPCTEDVLDQVNPDRRRHNAGNPSDEEQVPESPSSSLSSSDSPTPSEIPLSRSSSDPETSPERSPELFEDPHFPLNKAINPSTWGRRETFPGLEWLRVPEFAERIKKSPVLLPEQNLITDDVYQRAFPNCIFIAGLSELTQYPGLLKKIVPHQPNQNCFETGKVRFNLWKFGNWEEIVVDDRIPVVNKDEHFGARSSDPQVFWPPLLEKAYAKHCGGYDGVLFPSDGMAVLTGGLCETIDLKTNTIRDITESLEKAKMQKAMLFAGTKCNGDHDAIGLVSQHEYSVCKTFKITIRSGPLMGVHDFIILKNPHDPKPLEGWYDGQVNGYHGQWSKVSYEWKATPEDAKKEIDSHLGPDEFFVSFDTFKQYFDELSICHMDKKNLGIQPGGLNAHQVRGIYPNPELRLRLKDLSQDSQPSAKEPKDLYKNPRFLLKINGDENDLVDVIIGLMVDPKRFEEGVVHFDERKQKIIERLGTFPKLAKVAEVYQERRRLKSLGLWIFPIADENCHLQSSDITSYAKLVPKMGPEYTVRNELVEKFQLLPGTYVMIPAIEANAPDLEFLIRVFTEQDDVSLHKIV